MGKASYRRKKRRSEYMARLAREDPAKFHIEWNKRLASWQHDAYRRANLVGNNSHASRYAFSVIEKALKELMACGKKAFMLEADSTIKILTNACCRAIARATDHHLYRLGNSYSNYRIMQAGTHKPPR